MNYLLAKDGSGLHGTQEKNKERLIKSLFNVVVTVVICILIHAQKNLLNGFLWTRCGCDCY